MHTWVLMPDTLLKHVMSLDTPNNVARPPWDPVAKPWRVSVDYACPRAAGGWSSTVATFATRAEAEAVFQLPMEPETLGATLTQAMNPESWLRNGGWRLHASRGRARRRSR